MARRSVLPQTAVSRETSAFAPLTHWGRVSGRLARRGFWPLALVYALLLMGGVITQQFWPLALSMVLLWPVAASAVRRLHDTGRSGRWLWLLFLPLLCLIPLWLLAQQRTPERTRFPSIDDSPIPMISFAVICLLAIVIQATMTITQIPAGSMKPGLLPGDIALVSRWSPGTRASCAPARCPWGGHDLPERGDIVMVRVENSYRVGRVLGLPGDEIAMHNGLLSINGQPMTREAGVIYSETFAAQGPLGRLPRCRGGAVGLGARCDKLSWVEHLPNGRRYRVLDAGDGLLDSYRVSTVPDNALFLLGDNRDNAVDSRVVRAAGGLGFVPAQDVVGRVVLVLASIDGPAWQIWKIRLNRVLIRP